MTQWRQLPPAYDTLLASSEDAVVIRRAREADGRLLADLAALDSAEPLTGAALVALVDGTALAALALDGDRVIADPFHPTAAVVELLTLRAGQLRAAESRPQRSLRRRWVAHRARA